jgi:hypothetical protein
MRKEQRGRADGFSAELQGTLTPEQPFLVASAGNPWANPLVNCWRDSSEVERKIPVH